ncbi:MAG: sigma-70 family RNA polymerase sigma factor [Lachnospiraceae bacterium]|nr:sigma-70 family RNA polymerase sigma factor [Lachnospiraceae bacterium]
MKQLRLSNGDTHFAVRTKSVLDIFSIMPYDYPRMSLKQKGHTYKTALINNVECHMTLKCGEQEVLIEDIVRKYSAMLYRVAMIRMQNQSDAQEVVQDTFLKLVSKVKSGMSFADEEHLKAWLLTVAINRGKSIVMLAWNRKTEGLDSIRQVADDTKSESYAFEYVQKLPKNYRIAIDLFYYEELTTEQIAVTMKTKPATVRSYLHRGREKLKQMMEADGYVG